MNEYSWYTLAQRQLHVGSRREQSSQTCVLVSWSWRRWRSWRSWRSSRFRDEHEQAGCGRAAAGPACRSVTPEGLRVCAPAPPRGPPRLTPPVGGWWGSCRVGLLWGGGGALPSAPLYHHCRAEQTVPLEWLTRNVKSNAQENRKRSEVRCELRRRDVRWGEARRVRWGEARWDEVRRGEARWGEVSVAGAQVKILPEFQWFLGRVFRFWVCFFCGFSFLMYIRYKEVNSKKSSYFLFELLRPFCLNFHMEFFCFWLSPIHKKEKHVAAFLIQIWLSTKPLAQDGIFHFAFNS